MKKYIAGIAISISLFTFTGCGAQDSAADMDGENMTQASENVGVLESADDVDMTQASETMNNTKTAQASEPEMADDMEIEQEFYEEPVEGIGIEAVGRLEEANHKIYSRKDSKHLIGEADFQWLIVDDSFAGASFINEYLYEKEVVSAWAVFSDNVYADEEFFDEYNGVPYSYGTGVSCLRYFDANFVSFVQEAYDYCGGAHGLPIWEGYAFDLESGERLLLTDIISNTEEELKDIVAKYFGEKIDENPQAFWEDAKETVYDLISLETTNFVLTDEGICFFIHPYSIAAYSEGMQEVTVPYSEFELFRFSPRILD